MKNNIISDWLDKYGEPEIDKKVGMKLEEMNKEKYNQIDPGGKRRAKQYVKHGTQIGPGLFFSYGTLKILTSDLN